MPFRFEETGLPGMFLIEPRVFPDDRGFFLESWKRSDFHSVGITEEFYQDNHSKSSAGVLRGLHYQTGTEAQGKLVRVVAGAVWDVGVDIREDSPTFRKWFGIELTSENHRMLYIPPGFAHGFLTLEDETEFLYKCTSEYSPSADAGIIWNDPDLAIEWPIPSGMSIQVSEKDSVLPSFGDRRR